MKLFVTDRHGIVTLTLEWPLRYQFATHSRHGGALGTCFCSHVTLALYSICQTSLSCISLFLTKT